MKKAKFFTSLLLAGVMIFAQVSAVLAAPMQTSDKIISGIVTTIVWEVDASTGQTIVFVTVQDPESLVEQIVPLSIKSALKLGVITLDGDGNPVPNQLAIGQPIEIKPSNIIPEEKQNPVGNALSTFFSDIEGLEYSVIMAAHEAGSGFGVIAQALWITRKLGGDASIFQAVLTAKETGDFSDFILEDGTSPTSWGEFRKAVMDGDKKGNLGVIMSNKEHEKNVPANVNNNNKNKTKTNNGKSGENGNGNGNGKEKKP